MVNSFIEIGDFFHHEEEWNEPALRVTRQSTPSACGWHIRAKPVGPAS